MSEYAAQRLNMVEGQVRANDVTDRRIQGAMAAVARERYVPGHLSPVAYIDRCLEVGSGRYILDPRSFSKLLQLAAIGPGDRALDVGCASGYSAEVLSNLAKEVVALEANSELAAVAREFLASCGNVELVVGALTEGAPDRGPFDVIFLNGAVEFFPDALLGQLAEGGRLVGVLRNAGGCRARLIVNSGGSFSERVAFDADVPTLPGFERVRSFVF
jgi:protein-L-isoaspartate(D-aspartate) O-methyltransferase